MLFKEHLILIQLDLGFATDNEVGIGDYGSYYF